MYVYIKMAEGTHSILTETEYTAYKRQILTELHRIHDDVYDELYDKLYNKLYDKLYKDVVELVAAHMLTHTQTFKHSTASCMKLPLCYETQRKRATDRDWFWDFPTKDE